MFGLPDIPDLGPMLKRGVVALERLAEAQEQANRLTLERIGSADEVGVTLSRIESALSRDQKAARTSPAPAKAKPAPEGWGKVGKP